MTAKGEQNGKCTICVHEKRYEIELALVAGVSCRAVGKKYAVSRDAAWRHLRNHVPPERRAQLVAGPMKLSELAAKAAEENLSLVDYLGMIRAALLSRFFAASEADDRTGTALLAGRLTELLRLSAQVTGELSRATSSVTNNTLILGSPLMADLQQMLVMRLRPYPEAARAVLEGLEELSNRAIGVIPAEVREVPALEAPRD